MHIFLVVVGVIIVLIVMSREFKAKDTAAREEGLAPLSHAQRKAARKAAHEGRPYQPKRRPYGTPPPYKPGRKRFD